MAGEINWGLLDTSLPMKAASAYSDGQRERAQNALASAQLQTAQRQNKLADLAMQDDEATRQAYRDNAGDLGKTVEALRNSGQYKQSNELTKQMNEQQKAKLSQAIDAAKLMKHHAASVYANPTAENATFAVQQFGQQSGQDMTQTLAQLQLLGNDPEKIRQWAAGHAMEADKMLPKLSQINNGGSNSLIAQDPLSGKVISQQDTQKTATPDALMTDSRMRSEGALNRGVQLRGQNMVDSRARENSGQGKAPAGYRNTADGNMEPIPGGPADQKAQALAGQKAAGATDVDSAIASLRDAYDRLEKGGGITSTKNGSLSNIAASSSSSGVGQVLGRTFGTQNQSARNDIAMTRPALLAALMKATGMSAKQMDSNAELKLWMTTATDPQLDVESNRRALDKIERKYMGNAGVAPKAPASAGSYDDAAKEARYQAWKASQGK